MNPVKLCGKAGVTIYASTGRAGYGVPDRMSSLHFYKAYPGSQIILRDVRYLFNVATYSLEVNPKYIYTYDYEPECSWTTYNGDLNGNTYRQENYVFEQECYFRLCFKRTDGGAFTSEDEGRFGMIVDFEQGEASFSDKPFFREEACKTAASLLEQAAADAVMLAVVTDSHYTVNGTWDDTASNIAMVHNMAAFHGIVHLGDLTDGMLPAELTRDYAEMVMQDLIANQVPLYVVPGNHDSNYFMGNPEPFEVKAQADIYLSYTDRYTVREGKLPNYYFDYPESKLRCFVLHSFDYREDVRYGYAEETLDWLSQSLQCTETGYSILLFSHVPPLANLHYWSNEIRNGEALISLLEDYQRESSNEILGLVHGHNHADAVDLERDFPIISIGCSKLEYFTDKKPKGSYTPPRQRGTVSQDLWDAVRITPSQSRIDLIRFGAGEDRIVYRDLNGVWRATSPNTGGARDSD
ncbi:metallophosphoesterase family protein [Paenibacillus glufosinatiresistens]|uniref:metallophosphoesterase family protein n=1 Tax=Paenibacillus glufosinatiresistens TaxID=3070657 RepID=UPI00286E464A|nr:metallophosphoesterase [Paenibacillus sp. YX.27]